MAAVGILTVDQVLMITYGSWTGSSLILVMLSVNLRGTSRQVAMCQVLINTLMCTIFIPMLFIETHLGIPLLKAAVLAINVSLAEQIGIFVVLLNVIFNPLLLLALNPIVRLYERLWPPTSMEKMSETRYIHDHAYENSDTALMLARLEQFRLLSIFSEYLDAVRRGARLDELGEAARFLISRIDEFLEELRVID